MTRAYALVPASYVYLCRGGEVLLQLRANTGFMDGHWAAGAAGHLEPGETARDAAVREVAEELGVHIRPGDLQLVTVLHRTDGSDDPIEQRVEWFWTVQRWQGTPTIQEPAKCAGIDWFPLTALPEPVPGYEQMVLQGIITPDFPATTTYGFPATTTYGFAGT